MFSWRLDLVLLMLGAIVLLLCYIAVVLFILFSREPQATGLSVPVSAESSASCDLCAPFLCECSESEEGW